MHKILIIIQRSNGDVFLSSPLINALKNKYKNVQIDMLVNEDTLGIAKMLDHVQTIHTFSYKRKKEQGFVQEQDIIKAIYKKYDMSINLTASDRSVIYALLASKYAISAVEPEEKKSWWKRLFLKHSYRFDSQDSIVRNNIKSLALLGIECSRVDVHISCTEKAKKSITEKLKIYNIKQYLIFHPSAQYRYKIYPTQLRHTLLECLNTLNIPIIITGAKTPIDMEIKAQLPSLENLYDFIGKTTLDEYVALSEGCMAYIGMDTLNMHIAAAQDKRIFAIFGPTLLSIWSPWSNLLQKNTNTNMPMQTYGNITLFQAQMSCVACGKAGCDDAHGKSDCLYQIAPQIVCNEVKVWLTK